MAYPNEQETLETVLSPFSVYMNTQLQLNKDTIARYEALSFFEREEISVWLKLNLNTIPIPSVTKHSGLESLLMGDYLSQSALSLIRYAMKRLNCRF